MKFSIIYIITWILYICTLWVLKQSLEKKIIFIWGSNTSYHHIIRYNCNRSIFCNFILDKVLLAFQKLLSFLRTSARVYRIHGVVTNGHTNLDINLPIEKNVPSAEGSIYFRWVFPYREIGYFRCNICFRAHILLQGIPLFKVCIRFHLGYLHSSHNTGPLHGTQNRKKFI